MEHIEHLGIAVKDLEVSIPLYEKLLNTKCYKREEVRSENVITAFFQLSNNKVELLQATSSESAIAKFIEKRGEGIHHVAFSVADIKAEMERLRNDGFRLLNEEPKRGADNKLICFVHPKDASGVLMELCQEISEQV
ncbi:MAG: methylmalonyl-CoA epimerase [Flavobacteriales bacterium]|nr:methylmalonyl-CoA epimerase [Flavobacteriales bacterium]MCB9205061.1 methylmalonyl-CoA epimerase [Flavobacteriales bacterium]